MSRMGPVIDRYAAGGPLLVYATTGLDPAHETARVGPGTWSIAPAASAARDGPTCGTVPPSAGTEGASRSDGAGTWDWVVLRGSFGGGVDMRRLYDSG